MNSFSYLFCSLFSNIDLRLIRTWKACTTGIRNITLVATCTCIWTWTRRLIWDRLLGLLTRRSRTWRYSINSSSQLLLCGRRLWLLGTSTYGRWNISWLNRRGRTCSTCLYGWTNLLSLLYMSRKSSCFSSLHCRSQTSTHLSLSLLLRILLRLWINNRTSRLLRNRRTVYLLLRTTLWHLTSTWTYTWTYTWSSTWTSTWTNTWTCTWITTRHSRRKGLCRGNRHC